MAFYTQSLHSNPSDFLILGISKCEKTRCYYNSSHRRYFFKLLTVHCFIDYKQYALQIRLFSGVLIHNLDKMIIIIPAYLFSEGQESKNVSQIFLFQKFFIRKTKKATFNGLFGEKNAYLRVGIQAPLIVSIIVVVFVYWTFLIRLKPKAAFELIACNLFSFTSPSIESSSISEND